MNRDLIISAVVVAALAVGAGVALRGDKDADAPREEPTPRKEDPRPIVDDNTRTKGSPTPEEKRDCKPGRLRDGGFVVWTITSAGERVRIAPPCVIPNCWTLADGGWDDNAVVDCRAVGPRGTADGGPRWNGCNVITAEESVGARCVPTACSVSSTGVPDWEVLR